MLNAELSALTDQNKVIHVADIAFNFEFSLDVVVKGIEIYQRIHLA